MAESSRPSWLRRLGATALAVLLLAIGSGLAYVLREQGLGTAANWAQLVSILLAAGPLIPLVMQGWRQPGDRFAVSTPEQINQAQQVIAHLVLQQWREEITIRQLDDPAPLAVRWRLTELGIMDHPGHATRPRGIFRLTRGRPRHTGRSDRIDDMVKEFRDLTRRRLVILGGPGMGKTTLAVLLLRHLLENPKTGEPVPVMLTMSGWDPDRESFHDWLTNRLSNTYPALRSDAFGPNATRALVTNRLILPILDGLDELPEPVRPKVITALNSTLTNSDALILTCRTAEYEAAIKVPEGRVLVAGAVIEAQPLQPVDAARYLTHALRLHPPGTVLPDSAGTWPSLLAALTNAANTPLTEALTTPLALWLLRKIYIETRANPAELLAPGRFTTADQITNHLLDHLTEATITANPPRQPHGYGGLGGHPFRPLHAWTPHNARRWLSFLARHLHSANTTDLVWWQLHNTLPRRTIRLTTMLINGFSGGLTLGFTAWLLGGPLGGLAGGITGMFSGGLVGWLTSSTPTGPNAEPVYANLRLRGRTYLLIRRLPVRLPFWLAVGLPFGLPIGLAAGLAGGFEVGLPFGLAFGLAVGLAAGLVDWAENPQTDDKAQTPIDTLRHEVQMIYLRSLVSGLTIGLALGFVAGLMFGLARGFMFALLAGFMFGLAGGLVGALARSSGTYFITVTHLSIRRRAPHHLMRFLEDAHRLGLLRQTGAVYQFRHAKLQERLASAPTRHD